MYLAYDTFTILRYFHVFHEDSLNTLLKWTDTIWFRNTALCILSVSSVSAITAAIEILPTFKTNTYDLMVYFCQKSLTYQPYLVLNGCQILYTLTIIGFTVVVHWQILSHLNTKFVNLAGITKQIRDKRHFQNKINFLASLFHQACRLFSIIPFCIVCMLHRPHYKLFMIAHFVSYTYESTAVSCFYLTTNSIFDKKQKSQLWTTKFCHRMQRKWTRFQDTFEYNLDKVLDAMLRSTAKPTVQIDENDENLFRRTIPIGN